jgi:uncharacterized membrane protein YgcG
MPAESELAEVTLSFLEIAFHSILFARGIYPKTSFSRVSAFGTSTWQSRHPGVCFQLHSLLSSLHSPLKRHEIEAISLVIEYDELNILNHSIQDIQTLNTSNRKSESYTFEVSFDEDGGRSTSSGSFASYSDLDTMFASALSQILSHDLILKKVPQEGTEWTVVVKSHEVLAGPHKTYGTSSGGGGGGRVDGGGAVDGGGGGGGSSGPDTVKGLIGTPSGAADHWIRLDKGDAFSNVFSSSLDNSKARKDTKRDEKGHMIASRPIKTIKAGSLLLLLSHEASSSDTVNDAM